MEATLHPPIQKVTISGPTLSSLLSLFSSSPSSLSGLLFGHFSTTSPTLSDDSPSPSPSSPSLIATITSFISTPSSHHHNHRNLTLIGHFSARRKSPLRPSLSDFSLSHSHSHSLSSNQPNLLFLLITTPFPDPQTLIHTLDHRIYHFNPSSSSFHPLQLDIVNIGPAFRGQYSAFCANSGIPGMTCDFRAGGGSPMRQDGGEKEKESLREMKKVSKDQKELGMYADGYEIGSLSRLVGSDAVSYMGGVEELYEKMLVKLERLARVVETSSAGVRDQENHNMLLRRRVAGLE